jgi:hypothetical protein
LLITLEHLDVEPDAQGIATSGLREPFEKLRVGSVIAAGTQP